MSCPKKLRGNEGCRQVNIIHLFIKYLLNANYVPGIVLNVRNCNMWYHQEDSLTRFVQGYTVQVIELESEPRATGLQSLLISMLRC